MNVTRHELTALVSGYTWGGFLGEMEYTLKPSEVDNFKTLDDFKSIAGDFESITYVELLWAEVKTKYEVKIFE